MIPSNSQLEAIRVAERKIEKILEKLRDDNDLTIAEILYRPAGTVEILATAESDDEPQSA